MFSFCKKSTFFMVTQIISIFLINSSVLSAVEKNDFLWGDPDARRSKSVPPYYKYKDPSLPIFLTEEQNAGASLLRSNSETEVSRLLKEDEQTAQQGQPAEYVFVTFPLVEAETMKDLLRQEQQRQRYQTYARAAAAAVGATAIVTKIGPFLLKGAPFFL